MKTLPELRRDARRHMLEIIVAVFLAIIVLLIAKLAIGEPASQHVTNQIESISIQ